MYYSCNDCSYNGKRVIVVDKSIMCPACGGNARIPEGGIRDLLERYETTSKQKDIENEKCELETIVDEWHV